MGSLKISNGSKNRCNSHGIDRPAVILDNTRIHHYRGLFPVIEELGSKMSNLPRYGPFLKLIENVFSVSKNLVVRGRR